MKKIILTALTLLLLTSKSYAQCSAFNVHTFPAGTFPGYPSEVMPGDDTFYFYEVINQNPQGCPPLSPEFFVALPSAAANPGRPTPNCITLHPNASLPTAILNLQSGQSAAIVAHVETKSSDDGGCVGFTYGTPAFVYKLQYTTKVNGTIVGNDASAPQFFSVLDLWGNTCSQ